MRLGNLARLVPGMSPAQIDRYAQERQITVVSNLYQKPLGEAMQQALGIVAELGMPPGYQAVQLGQAKLMAEAFRNFLVAFLLALAFIYMALAAQFESFVHPITIMVSMFLAIPFGLLALVLSGMTLNIYAIMGMFLLIGVVKKNAILQVDYTNVLRGRGLSRFEAQLEADRARLRPILMTTLRDRVRHAAGGARPRATARPPAPRSPSPSSAGRRSAWWSRSSSRRSSTRSSTTSAAGPGGSSPGGRRGGRARPSGGASRRD